MNRLAPCLLGVAVLGGCAGNPPVTYTDQREVRSLPVAPPPVPEPTPVKVTYPGRLKQPPPELNAQRLEEPNPVFGYHPAANYTIHTKPFHVTTIGLEPGEQLLGITTGDSERWIIENISMGNIHKPIEMVTVKPVYPFTSTNLVLSTDRRLYHIGLVSGWEGEDEPFNTSVRWDYSDEREQGLQIAAAPR